jgi:hypothetical protein
MSKGGIFKYVAHHEASKYEALGWEIAVYDLGPPHNAYSCLYKWVGKGRPRLPYDDEERDRELRDFDDVWPANDKDQ